jgi:hypothetical protein
MTLNDKLIEIQTRFKSKKSRFNSFGKYHFRSAEDILEAIKPFLKELGVTVTINEDIVDFFSENTNSYPPMIKTTATVSDGENAIHAVAIVGVDLNQKGMQVPQQFGSASSYGKKYALGNLFLIDDTQDSDASNTHDTNKSATATLTSTKDPAFDKAKSYIKSGGKLDAIKKKYKLSAEVEKALETI